MMNSVLDKIERAISMCFGLVQCSVTLTELPLNSNHAPDWFIPCLVKSNIVHSREINCQSLLDISKS
jgi:hypothetical protein